MDSVFLEPRDWDALEEHALTPYLPFLGGVRFNARFNYTGPKAKRVLFYVVRFEPELYYQSGGCRLSTANDFLNLRSGLPKDPLEEKLDERFFEYEKNGEAAKAKCCEEWLDSGFETEGTLSSESATGLGSKQFLKTGLTSSSARQRGGKAYSKVFFQEEIEDPLKAFKKPDSTRAAAIETLVQLKLFYKYWKEACWLYGPKRILYECDSDEFSHMRVTASPPGLTESLMWQGVEEKISNAIDIFTFLNGLSNRDLGAALREVYHFNQAWRWAAQIKQRQYVFLRELLLRSDFDEDHFEEVKSKKSWGISMPRTKEYDFLKKAGFHAKWFPVDSDDLQDVYKLSADQVILAGTHSWMDEFDIPHSKVLS